MSNTNAIILDSDLIAATTTERRRKLLPWWMKFFTWLFMIFGAFVPFASVLGMFSGNFNISLYGLDSSSPFSFIGISLIGIYLFKGITSFGLWTEKDWAIRFGQIDAIIGIVICFFVFVATVISFMQNGNFNFRIDIVLLILYYVRLNKIKPEWKARKSG